ncbi:nucleolar protein 58-like [Cimex lectularius]|uniref:Uncharacterized protein n=1 Tax=Cimex lectularius TaxID=79782 RepID=A0A8I6RN56_CIMLE|nr:nucleolar protein 58-like [Cimex lectularius]
MELSQVLGGQYAFHGLVAGFVLILAVLVFAFGFKSAEEPPFDKLSGHEDRRAAGKKRKPKDKKSQMNGHVTAVTESKKSDQKVMKKEEKKETEKSPLKEKAVKQEKKSPTKTTNKDTKDNLNGVDNRKVKGKGKENVELKSSKKNKIVEEKPKDFDDGEWEQALSRKDKKNRKTALEEIQPKSEKKKEKKKAREEVKPAPTEPEEQPDFEHEPSMNEMLPQEKPSGQQVEVQPAVVDEKVKKPKKKKPSETQNVAESMLTEEKEAYTDSPSPPKLTVKVEASEALPLNVSEFDSPLAFDELGDTWKEARAPKKGNKKKSRKD